MKIQRKKVTKKMELCLLKEKTKLEDARVLNSNRERERERAMLCRMRKVTEREACVCVYICRENRNFGVVVVVK